MRSSIFQVLKNLTIYFSKPQSCLYLRMKVIQSHSFKARRSKLCMRAKRVAGGVAERSEAPAGRPRK